MPSSATSSCPPELVDRAIRLVEASGPVLKHWFRAPLGIDIKSDDSPVTHADREAEAAMRELIAREAPEDGIVGEEYGVERPEARRIWVLDPLDGTRAFVVGKPLFGTLVALLEDGQPIVGVIDMPILGERWVGARGHPTTFNGAPVSTRACESLARARLNTTSPEMFPDGVAADAFRRLRGRVADCSYGGDCYGYGLLAAGFVDVVFETGMQPYDYLALVPVIEGAGGRITDWNGQPLGLGSRGSVLATGTPRIHEEALTILAEDADD